MKKTNKSNGRFIVNFVVNQAGKELLLTERNGKAYTREQWDEYPLQDTPWVFDEKTEKLTCNSAEIDHEYWPTEVIIRDGERDLITAAQQIAFSSGQWRNGQHQSRWYENYLYITRLGKYICQKVWRTNWQGESNEYKAIIATTEEEVFKFFGMDGLAKEVYEEANIDYSEFVE